MSIISVLPNTLTNGSLADATQVMSDLNQIVNNVNLNAAENGANASITSLSGLTTPLSVGQGGTAATTAAAARTSLGLDPLVVPTGTIIDYIGTTAPTGYVLADGKTLGDASSGATERANADTQNLFTLLWNSWADAQAPVSTGRGASATADFNAHKTITLPDLRGRSTFGIDNLGGSAANRITAGVSGITGTTPGASGGDQNLQTHGHTATATVSAHTHGVDSANGGIRAMRVGTGSNDYQTAGSGTGSGTFDTVSATDSTTPTASVTVNNFTGGSSGNVPPAMMVTKAIKL